MKALLDTHVLLWWFDRVPRLSDPQLRALHAADEKNPLLVADITLWEIATLSDLGRIRLRPGGGGVAEGAPEHPGDL